MSSKKKKKTKKGKKREKGIMVYKKLFLNLGSVHNRQSELKVRVNGSLRLTGSTHNRQSELKVCGNGTLRLMHSIHNRQSELKVCVNGCLWLLGQGLMWVAGKYLSQQFKRRVTGR